jgi:hypothetical protein
MVIGNTSETSWAQAGIDYFLGAPGGIGISVDVIPKSNLF